MTTRLRWGLLCIALAFALVACGGDGQRFDAIVADPMANPTLSFAEPVGQSSVEGSTGRVVFGSGKTTVHTTRFDVAPDDLASAAEELLAQAEAAGYRLELITSTELLPSGTYTGYNAAGTNMSLLITTIGVQVELR